MIRWNAVGYGVVAALLPTAVAWLVLGFVAGIGIVAMSGVVGGFVAGWITAPRTESDWRAGGYHGMLAGGTAGILIVATAAAIALGGSSVVADARPGLWTTAAHVAASPLAIPLFVLEGIAGGSAGGWLNFAVSGEV